MQMGQELEAELQRRQAAEAAASRQAEEAQDRCTFWHAHYEMLSLVARLCELLLLA